LTGYQSPHIYQIPAELMQAKCNRLRSDVLQFCLEYGRTTTAMEVL